MNSIPDQNAYDFQGSKIIPPHILDVIWAVSQSNQANILISRKKKKDNSRMSNHRFKSY